MKRPRYQIHVMPLTSSALADPHRVIDTDSIGMVESNTMSWVDACHLAQWLNERDRGYPRNIQINELFADYRFVENAPVVRELRQMQIQSRQNWLVHMGITK